jgi:hypothetical protein
MRGDGSTRVIRRSQENNQHGEAGQEQTVDIGPGESFRQFDQGDKGGADTLSAEQWVELEQDDDDPDAAHEPRNHRVGYIAHKTTQFDHAENDLQAAGHQDDCEDGLQVSRKGGNRRGHNDCHRPGRPGYLRWGAA